MKYTTPSYICEEIETTDIILASELNGVTIESSDDLQTGIASTDMDYILGKR